MLAADSAAVEETATPCLLILPITFFKHGDVKRCLVEVVKV
jgi:hypothetical protein